MRGGGIYLASAHSSLAPAPPALPLPPPARRSAGPTTPSRALSVPRVAPEASTWSRNQSREGRGYLPAAGTNDMRGRGIDLFLVLHQEDFVVFVEDMVLLPPPHLRHHPHPTTLKP